MGSAGFLMIILAFGFLCFVLSGRRSDASSQQQRMLNELHVGDEVLTAGGIYGEIVGCARTTCIVRIAPELEVRVARRAIASVIPAAARPRSSRRRRSPRRPPTPDT